MLSALRPRARTALQSFERRSGFGRRGVAKHLLYLVEDKRKAESLSRMRDRDDMIGGYLSDLLKPPLSSRGGVKA